MSPSTPDTSLAAQLVVSLLPNGISTPRLRRYKDVFSRKLKYHSFSGTNQFEVAERLDGLQEKSRILNNDELADGIHTRLQKLKQHSEKWLPDVLDLLLRLSDDPTSNTQNEWLANSGTLTPVVPPLTWAEIEADDPVDPNDQIWRVAEYGDLSSDDDVRTVCTTPIPSNAIPDREEEKDFPQAKLESVDLSSSLKALDHLKGLQFWQNFSNDSVELTEVQVIREILFMLQGLPTALFWKGESQIKIDQRFRLKHSSRESLVEVLSDFGQIAIRLDLLRTFTRKTQSQCVMQKLRSALESIIQHVDSQLCILEQSVLSMKVEAPATLLQLLSSVRDVVVITGSLSDYVADVQPKCGDMITCLELLFDKVCQTQASSNEVGFRFLSKIFFECLESYFRPVQDWMDQGKLPEDEATIFVTASRLVKELSQLWQKWYAMADGTAANRCPRFLQPLKAQILNTGKTIVFLHHLNVPMETSGDRSILVPLKSALTGEDTLLPFSELLATSLQASVESRLHNATSTLRNYLGNNCGLWKTLDALNRIYFGRNGHITDLIDIKIFAAIDRCDRNWNDRFVIKDLLQTAFGPSQSAEIERFAVKLSSRPSRNMPHRRLSVKLLKDLRIQFTLPWSIANIINRTSLARYQTVSTFLTQIRRARYMLERRSLLEVRSGRLADTEQERNLVQSLHHDLLLFINILYDHLTTLVIEEANAKLRQALSDAADIDGMTNAHNKYSSDLEDACLASKKLRPIQDKIVSILDLCIRYSDLNTPAKKCQASDADADADALSFVSATSYPRGRPRNEEGDFSEDDVESDDAEGYSTFVVPDESSLVDQLHRLREEYQKHLSFVVAGLNSMGSVREQGGFWGMLASRLHWRRERILGVASRDPGGVVGPTIWVRNGFG